MPGVTRAAHAEESAEVEVLFANMDKLKTLTKKIQGSLTRLETTGKGVQDAIKPIYGNTSRLQITNKNIDRINNAIDNMRKPLDRRRKEEPVIRAGIQRVGLLDYLSSMDRTSQALNDLQSSGLRSNQQAIAELNELLRAGNQELENAFRDTLKEEAQPIEPLHYITKNLAFPDISRDNSSKLRSIDTYVRSANAGSSSDKQSRMSTIFAEVRGAYIAATLQNLATASVSTIRKADPNALYRQGQSGIGTYSIALEKMFAAEYNNICPVFSREQWAATHSMAVQQGLDQFARTLSELHHHIKNNLLTDCFLAYEVVDLVSSMSFRLESRNPSLRQPIQDALRPIRETAKYSLTRMLEDVRNRVQQIQQIAPDASSERVTYDTMTRLQNMTLYIEPLGGIMASVGESGWKPPSNVSAAAQVSLDVGVPSRDLFASYLNDMIETLIAALDAKARTLLKSKTAQGVYLSNNIAVIDRTLTNTQLGSLQSDGGRTKLDQHRKKAQALYLDSWREPSVHLRDVQYTNRSSHPSNRPPSGSNPSVDSAAFVKALSNKDRDATKEKFKSFNSSFEACMQQHRTFKFEPEIENLLAREVASLIEPLYARFWDRYHEIDKGKGKYVKYSKRDVAGMLGMLG